MADINGTTPSTGTLPSTTPSKAASAQSSLNTNYDDFLKLLTAQLKNQDPTAPMDANQFTQQMVSLTGVEQAVNTNANLEKLITLNQSNQLTGAAAYIGKMVQADGSVAPLAKGQAEFTYNLPKTSESTVITISDASGKTVFTGSGEKTVGQYKYVWDGRDNNGNPQQSGDYTIAVKGLDSNNNIITATTSTASTVVAVTMDSGVTMLKLSNGANVSIDKVTGIANPTTTPATTTPPTS
jgi:flagellar basal-body rod modification protein FlgD